MQPEVRDSRDVHYSLALPTGARLADRYRLDRPLGDSSAFAITYVAEDASSGAPAVVKEFFPRSLVGRGPDGVSVRPHSPEDERDFVRALRRFVNEGAALAEITHPNLVRVRRLVEANGTAYLVTDRYDSTPLAELVRARGGRLSPADAGAIVQQVLSALEPLHAESVVHRDVSPKSVHVLAGGRPILLGFAARRHVGQQTSDLAPGFAAFEQYGTRDVGPWTDVYAAAALLYYLLTGNAPPTALERAAGETLASPAALVPELSPSVALAVLRGLALLPQQRPHAASELRRQLESAFADGVPQSGGARGVSHRPTAAELSALAGEEGGYDESHGHGGAAPLKFGMGGIVVPHEERGAARVLRKLGSVGALFRRQPSQPAPAAAAVPVPVASAPARVVEPDEKRQNPAPAARVPVDVPPVAAAPIEAVTAAAEPLAAAPLTEAPKVEAPKVEAPKVEVPEPQPTRERDRETRKAAPQPWMRREAPRVEDAPAVTPAPAAAAVDVRTGRAPAAVRRPPLAALADVEDDVVAAELDSARPRGWSKRSALAAAAAVVVFLGTGAAVLYMNGGLRAQGTRAEESAGTVSVQPPSATTPAPAASGASGAGAAVLQSASHESGSAAVPNAAPADDSSTRTLSTQHAASGTAPAVRERTTPVTSASNRASNEPAPNAGRAPVVPGVPNLNVSIQSAGVKLVPPEVLVGARSRLSNGEEQAEQGEYLAARRIFKTALQQLDSAWALYPESQALRSVRKEIEQADQNALRACIAENDLHRKRGEQPGACQ